MTDKDIKEIAEWLDSGMICYYHRPTKTIEYHPDPDDPYFEPDPWQETIDKVEEDWDNYDQFEKMTSNQGFEVMKDFADSLKDSEFQEKIYNRLYRPRPFQNFKNLIDNSDYRQNWFDFKAKAYIDFTKRQIGLKK
tara:strand:- start:177 stop:584 length:408 start_codon:yes stop_codon:yes gene_type:complete